MKGETISDLGMTVIPGVIDTYSKSVTEENFEEHFETVQNVINAYKVDASGQKVREISSGLYHEEVIKHDNLKDITKDSRYMATITAYVPQSVDTKHEADSFTKHVMKSAYEASKKCQIVKVRVEVK